MKSLRILALSSTAAIITAGSAIAADIGRPIYKGAVAPPVPYFTWTGLYAGVHLGAGWGSFHFSDPTDPTDQAKANPQGILGGLQLGYNYQMGNFVAGIETDVSWTGMKKSILDGDNQLSVKTPVMGTVTGRIGAVFDRTLLYVKGGYAWSQNRYYSVDADDGIVQNIKDNRSGWPVGTGVEWAFADRWTTRIEYNYVDFGSKTFTFFDPDDGQLSARVKNHDHLLKVGLNYRF